MTSSSVVVAASPHPRVLDPDEVPDLGPGRRAYVAGFLLDDRGRVVLVRKLRPAWQAGNLNGVGGKVEVGETPRAAMRREFVEETGVDVAGWEHLVCLEFAAGVVWFFRRFAEPAVLDATGPVTDEPIEVVRVADAVAADTAVIPNLRWLLPLAAYTWDRYTPFTVAEAPAGDPRPGTGTAGVPAHPGS